MGLLTFDVGADTGLLTYGGTTNLLTFHDLAVSPHSLNRGQINIPYIQSVAFSASGGTGPYTYACLSTLPAGVTFDATNRVFTGTPLIGGSYLLIIQATDSTGTVGNYAVAWFISSAVISIAPPTLPAGTEEAAYVQATPFAASGGVAPYTFSLESGTPPPGTAFNATDRIFQGIASTPGTYSNLVIKALDANGDVGRITVSIKINALTGIVIESEPILNLQAVSITGWTIRAYTNYVWDDAYNNLVLDDKSGGKEAYFFADFTNHNTPSIRLPSTTDSPDMPYVTYSILGIYDKNGKLKHTLLTNFFLRPDIGSPISLVTLRNSQKTLPPFWSARGGVTLAEIYANIYAYINEQGSGNVPEGVVIGPDSSTDNAIVRFDGTTGKLIKDSGVTVNDAGNLEANQITGVEIISTSLIAGTELISTDEDGNAAFHVSTSGTLNHRGNINIFTGATFPVTLTNDDSGLLIGVTGTGYSFVLPTGPMLNVFFKVVALAGVTFSFPSASGYVDSSGNFSAAAHTLTVGANSIVEFYYTQESPVFMFGVIYKGTVTVS